MDVSTVCCIYTAHCWAYQQKSIRGNGAIRLKLRSMTFLLPALLCTAATLGAQKLDYRLLATTKTSTMEKELNQAAQAGFVFGGAMGGESSFGGKEVIVVMMKELNAHKPASREYRLLATSKTGTMQKEMQRAGDGGFVYCGQTVFESTFGGREVAVILERDLTVEAKRIEYKLLATSRTSTMEKELKQAGEAGFKFLGVVVGQTAFGGKEVVSILQKVEK